MRHLARAALLAMAVGTAACAPAASPALTPSTGVTTLMTGWEQHFTIDWTVVPEPGDTRQLRGYVISHHGEFAERVRVLGQALDASGAVVAQRIEWVPGGVGGFGRAYFEVPHLPAAPTYRVTMWSYTWRQGDGDHH